MAPNDKRLERVMVECQKCGIDSIVSEKMVIATVVKGVDPQLALMALRDGQALFTCGRCARLKS